MQNIISDKKCTSCMSCYSACPVNAIEIREDKDRFFTPFINEDKCTKCGLCKKICPVLNKNKRSFSKKTEPQIYACTNKDDNVRINSASGGMFSVLADYVLSNNGYICGAVYDYDDDKIVKHIVSNKPEDLDKMRKSKYVQSYIGDCFKQIKELLDDNRLVLFSGTPCQVAGLNAICGEKKYDNLITVDLCCSLVTPQYLLKEYIKNVTGGNHKKISKIDMRNKITNWSSFSVLVEWIDKNGVLKKYYEPHLNTIFFKGFCEQLWKKNSCSKCIYATPERNSDFTLGDFWGIEKIDKTLNDEKGLSIVILNTDKSKKIFEQIKGNLEICRKMEYNSAIAIQDVLNGKSLKSHKNRDLFFKYMSNHYSPLELTKDLLGINKVKILTLESGSNYGAQLQSWALCEKIKQLGFDPVVIKRYLSKVENNNILKFRDRSIPITTTCYTEEEFEAELSDCNRVIIGGDQMFRQSFTEETYPFLRGLCDWVYGNCLIASYGSSFGMNFFNGNESLINESKKLLKRCDKLTVREKSGVDILKNTFGVDSKVVVDPALLLTDEDYNALINKKKLPKIKYDYVAYCILDENLGFKKIIGELKNKLDNKLINIHVDTNGKYYSPESWLNYIKNAKFIITDSFHCVVFSIIFRKPFIVVGRRDNEMMERINNLLNTYNLKSRKRNSLSEITNDDINNNSINWDNVYEILEKNRADSEKELLEILLMKPTYKEKYVNEELRKARLKSELEYKTQKYMPKKKGISAKDIFSVRNKYSNNKKYKVITILGLKIKFKVKC